MKRIVFIISAIVLSVLLLLGSLYLYSLGTGGGNHSKTVLQASVGTEEGTSSVGVPTPDPALEATPAGEPVPSSTGPAATPTQEPTPVPQDLPEDKLLKVTAVGDIMLGRGVSSRLRSNKKSITYPFEKVEGLLKQGDVVFGNMEHPVTDNDRSLQAIQEGVKGGKYVLRCKTDIFQAIPFAGFNVLSLANNHILDHYEEGLFDTMQILEDNGIHYAGAGKNIEEARKPVIIEKKGLKIAFLAYSDYSYIVYSGNPSIHFAAAENKAGVAPYKAEWVEEDILKIRDQVDLLFVSLHWGTEESFKVTQKQIEAAHRFIDLGADAILGHHPHQAQGMEIYKGKLIAYSLGNFIFDQNDPENQESFILNMEYEEMKLSKLEAVPVRIIGKMQVTPVYGTDAEALLRRQKELCSGLNTACRLENDKIVFDLQ